VLLPVVSLAGAVTLYLAQYAFPSTPTIAEVERNELARHGAATLSRNGVDMRHAEPRVLYTYALRTSQVVVTAYRQVNTVQATQREESADYFEVNILRKYWFDGVIRKAGANNVYTDRPGYSAIRLASLHYDGAYVMAGGTLNPTIVRVRATWQDGRDTTAPVKDGTFLFVREDGTEAAWVVGLDVEGNVVNKSLAFPYASAPPAGYATVQQIGVEGGIVVAGAFSLAGSSPPECIELTYLTAENARKYATGEGALTGQRVCMQPNPSASVFGPSASTVINKDTTVVAGRVLAAAATRVGLIWSDGFQQTVTVTDGLYLAQRPSAAIRVERFLALDDSGNVITP
jgi:hypothetical protein